MCEFLECVWDQTNHTTWCLSRLLQSYVKSRAIGRTGCPLPVLDLRLLATAAYYQQSWEEHPPAGTLSPTEKLSSELGRQRRKGKAYCLPGELSLGGVWLPGFADVSQSLLGAGPHHCSLQGTNTSYRGTSVWNEPEIHLFWCSQNLAYMSVVWKKDSSWGDKRGRRSATSFLCDLGQII